LNIVNLEQTFVSLNFILNNALYFENAIQSISLDLKVLVVV